MKNNKIFFLLLFILLTAFIFYIFYNYSLAFGTGDSMKPTLKECPLLVIDYSINKSSLEIGEIVLIDISDITVFNTNITTDKIAHRIVKNDIINQQILTRGDNNEIYNSPIEIDGKFDYSRVLGKVVFYVNLPRLVCKYNSQKDNIK